MSILSEAESQRAIETAQTMGLNWLFMRFPKAIFNLGYLSEGEQADVAEVRAYRGVIRKGKNEFETLIFQPVDAAGNPCGGGLNGGNPCPIFCD